LEKIKKKKSESKLREGTDVDDIPITDLIYFDLEYDSKPFGRLIVGLYGTVCEFIF
jgi:hypothetical protein